MASKTRQAVQCLAVFLLGIYLGNNFTGMSYMANVYGDSNKSPGMQLALQRTLDQSERQQKNLETLTLDKKQLEENLMLLKHGKEDVEHKLSVCQAEKDSKVSDAAPQSLQSDSNSLPRFDSEETRSSTLCRSILPSPVPTAMAVWSSFLDQIHKSSRLHTDARYMFSDLTAELLFLTTPRLPLSVKTLPRDWTSVQRVLEVGHDRWTYLQNKQAWNSTDIPRPVKIVIMGGSLLVGTNCRKAVQDLGIQIRMPRRLCTWAYRLEEFLNNLLGKNLVQVTKIAMGGTNTGTGSVVLSYDLIPEEARNPDIIINAYATNDMHILTVEEAISGNQTLRDKVFEMTQDFVRQVMKARCDDHPPPLLFHLDDYLGNEQREIWATTELSQGTQVLANYYGFASMSYGDLVRDWVYGDTKESWFSPEGWYGEEGFTREIHPGMSMHITAMWVAAYNFLNTVTTFCSLEWSQTGAAMEYKPIRGLPELSRSKKQLPGKPKLPPKGLPPVLTQDLNLEHVSDAWRNSSDIELRQRPKQCDDNYARCIFSWISSLSLQARNVTWIEEYFGAQTTENHGWELLKDGKMGFVPNSGLESKWILEFANVSQTIRTVNFFTMKSYGEKWADSALRVTTSQRSADDWEELNVNTFLGFHDKNTSEMYTEPIQLSHEVEAGGDLQIAAELVGGTTFKIMGLAICS